MFSNSITNETEDINVVFDESKINIIKSGNYMYVKWKIRIEFTKIMPCKRKR